VSIITDEEDRERGEAWEKMSCQLTTLYLDYPFQLFALLCDPVYHNTNVPRGKGEPVLLIPGFLAGDWTLGVMAGWLNRLGYHAYLSGIDWNVSCPNRTGELLGLRLAHIVRETGSPVVIVGHSLGGLLAYFLGTRFPGAIRHVVTLGSPIRGALRATHPFVQLTFRTLQALWRSADNAPPECGAPQCTCGFSQRVSSPLPRGVGFTAIFSKQDEIVNWHACLDPQGDNREVSGGHVGLVVNREVYGILADVLPPAAREKICKWPKD
jgi:pimeloyl-ACP methyl ester carboxylesterase